MADCGNLGFLNLNTTVHNFCPIDFKFGYNLYGHIQSYSYRSTSSILVKIRLKMAGHPNDPRPTDPLINSLVNGYNGM